MNLTKSILGPVTPELVLPYTDEECAPLPLKEFPESEEDIDNLTDANGGDGSSGRKTGVDGEGKVAEDAELENMDVNKNAEAKTHVAADVATEDAAQV
ncbi:hypothetical protein RHMOL_Rhmol06G0111600 [Rhododendron molle]|uniref:Uncharacterized protein n=1 Tax=Rhododendron molle TaxID=49168 RepID=A0ACC0NCZ6_RHOML|nr:hypothetical protein RHMOL_Rhmol06G0111600 [Rhododendron molle]